MRLYWDVYISMVEGFLASEMGHQAGNPPKKTSLSCFLSTPTNIYIYVRLLKGREKLWCCWWYENETWEKCVYPCSPQTCTFLAMKTRNEDFNARTYMFHVYIATISTHIHCPLDVYMCRRPRQQVVERSEGRTTLRCLFPTRPILSIANPITFYVQTK